MWPLKNCCRDATHVIKLLSSCADLKCPYCWTSNNSRVPAQNRRLFDGNGSIQGPKRENSRINELIWLGKPDIWWTTMINACHMLAILVTLLGVSMCQRCAVSNFSETYNCSPWTHRRYSSTPILTYFRFARLDYQRFYFRYHVRAFFWWQCHNSGQRHVCWRTTCVVSTRWALLWSSRQSPNAFVCEMGFPEHWIDSNE